jgi:hypothetical protein
MNLLSRDNLCCTKSSNSRAADARDIDSSWSAYVEFIGGNFDPVNPRMMGFLFPASFGSLEIVNQTFSFWEMIRSRVQKWATIYLMRRSSNRLAR